MSASLFGSSEHACPCGDRLWTRAELLASGDDMDAHIAEAYLDDHSGYCMGEDDVVPLRYAAEVIRRRSLPAVECDCDAAFGCDKCCVPPSFGIPS